MSCAFAIIPMILTTILTIYKNVHITDKYYEGKCIYQNIGHKDPYFSNTFDTVDYAYEVKVLGTSIDEAISNYPEYFL